MTAHEVFTSLLWIVLLSYVAYLGWFIVTTVSGWGEDDQKATDPQDETRGKGSRDGRPKTTTFSGRT